MIYVLLLTLILLFIAIAYILQRIQIRRITNQLKNGEKIRITLNHRDIEALAETINKSIQNQKQTQQDILIREEALKESIANLSHDLRTPLTAIQGYMTLLKECNPEEKERYLNIMELKSASLQDLINDFFTLSLLEDHKQSVEIESIDLISVITEMLMTHYPLFAERDLTPQVSLPNERIQIMGVQSYCERIIQNLIINAIKHSTENISLKVTKDETDCYFTISNSVTGMEGQDLSKLFDRFYMRDKSRSNGGSGLGLYIVKVLVEKIGGEVVEISLEGNQLSIMIRFQLAMT